MTPESFIEKWSRSAGGERQTVQEHFCDLCRLLDALHADLDAAVAAAYGWPADISEADATAALLALNLSRAAGRRGG